jgi:hypothetical protein
VKERAGELETGHYVMALCCTKCDWSRKQFIPVPFSICPDCGSKLCRVPGRWQYREIKRRHWLFFTERFTRWERFLRMDNEQDKSQEN